MKYLTPLLLILSFIGIAVFGFTIFDHGMHDPSMYGSNNDCVASVVDGVVCPTNIVSMALHHISVLQTFSQTLVPSTVSILLLSLLLIAISLALLRKNLFYPQPLFLFHRHRNPTKPHQQQKITSWLALFEHSPALS